MSTSTMNASERHQGHTRLTTIIGAAMIAISAGGLVHHWAGLNWDIKTQLIYALIGGIAAWFVTRPKRDNKKG